MNDTGNRTHKNNQVANLKFLQIRRVATIEHNDNEFLLKIKSTGDYSLQNVKLGE